MKLSDVFSNLAYGELSQLGLCDQDTGVVVPARLAAVVSHTNLGLTALYSRFPLKQGRLAFLLQANQRQYILDTNEDTHFTDSEGDFLDDILKIESVFTAEGTELPLNCESAQYNCTTPTAKVLRIPLEIANKVQDLPANLITDSLLVVYRANHPTIAKPGSSFNPDRVDIELPTSHLEALLLFIASRVHNPVGMVNEFNAGNNYAAKYEAACKQLETSNLRVDQDSQNTRLQRNGWA